MTSFFLIFVLNGFEPKIKICEVTNKYLTEGEIKIVISIDEIDPEIFLTISMIQASYQLNHDFRR